MMIMGRPLHTNEPTGRSCQIHAKHWRIFESFILSLPWPLAQMGDSYLLRFIRFQPFFYTSCQPAKKRVDIWQALRWPSRPAYGNLWPVMAIYGKLWQSRASYGNLRQPMTTHGNVWQLMATYGILWQVMATLGNLWQPMASYGNL